KVRPGEDSLLQCQSPRGDVIILLEWRRSDLKSDTYVFFFRNQRPYENYQHKFFKGRVELRDPTMKDGDVSVILKNVSTSDTGTYECEITVRNTEGVVTETKHSRKDEIGRRHHGGLVAFGLLLAVIIVVVAVVISKKKEE
uniref:Ig-like domain-containing protein n=1 Tax=Neolamprologus brichardi TaxID=32507 RepID=A0A3Q4GDN4_NEOBR